MHPTAIPIKVILEYFLLNREGIPLYTKSSLCNRRDSTIGRVANTLEKFDSITSSKVSYIIAKERRIRSRICKEGFRVHDGVCSLAFMR